ELGSDGVNNPVDRGGLRCAFCPPYQTYFNNFRKRKRRYKIMSRYKIVIFLFIANTYLSTVAAKNVMFPVDNIMPPSPTLDGITGSYEPHIYWMTPMENDLEITWMNVWMFWGDIRYPTYEMYFDSYATILFNLDDFTFSEYIIDEKTMPNAFRDNSDLDVEGLTIDLDGVKISLKNIPYYVTIHNQIIKAEDFYAKIYTTIWCVKYSSINQYFGVLLEIFSHDKYVEQTHSSNVIGLFSSKTGEPIYYRKIYGNDGDFVESNLTGFQYGLNEIYLSPDEDFLIGRSFKKDDLDPELVITKIVMIDVVNRRIVEEADKDVAFTRDGEYFVTERNEVPSLVRSSTLQTVLTYEIDAPMLAAAFSPDDHRLYIADTTNKIYVFESGVDSGCEKWEVMK
ncbi:MAG: hypothetical protein JXR73_04830, partial [Candidatus Omnitrophica bacterium]|nr:hypothetical protein [Candidatus Omnitrophota bacterium]